MNLYYQLTGSGQPLIIIHGLFGSSDNWRSMATYFSKYYQVISVDLRNHGRSPHSDKVDFDSMAEDIATLCDGLNLQEVIVLGHSLGGKVAMQFAADYPHRVAKLVIVDIAPRRYFSEHTPLMDAMMAMDLTQLTQRSEADALLATAVTDKTVRQFLLMNLNNSDDGFYWRIHLPALKQHYQDLMAPVCEQNTLTMPALFVYGELSDYVSEADQQQIRQLFTQPTFIEIAGAGHWVQAEKPQQFKKVVEDFLRDDQS